MALHHTINLFEHTQIFAAKEHLLIQSTNDHHNQIIYLLYNMPCPSVFSFLDEVDGIQDFGLISYPVIVSLVLESDS